MRRSLIWFFNACRTFFWTIDLIVSSKAYITRFSPQSWHTCSIGSAKSWHFTAYLVLSNQQQQLLSFWRELKTVKDFLVFGKIIRPEPRGKNSCVQLLRRNRGTWNESRVRFSGIYHLRLTMSLNFYTTITHVSFINIFIFLYNSYTIVIHE